MSWIDRPVSNPVNLNEELLIRNGEKLTMILRGCLCAGRNPPGLRASSNEFFLFINPLMSLGFINSPFFHSVCLSVCLGWIRRWLFSFFSQPPLKGSYFNPLSPSDWRDFWTSYCSVLNRFDWVKSWWDWWSCFFVRWLQLNCWWIDGSWVIFSGFFGAQHLGF